MTSQKQSIPIGWSLFSALLAVLRKSNQSKSSSERISYKVRCEAALVSCYCFHYCCSCYFFGARGIGSVVCSIFALKIIQPFMWELTREATWPYKVCLSALNIAFSTRDTGIQSRFHLCWALVYWSIEKNHKPENFIINKLTFTIKFVKSSETLY